MLLRIPIPPWPRRRRRRGTGYYTVLLLSHARPRFRTLQLSRPFLVVAALTLGLLAGSGLWSPHLFLRVREQSVTLDRLEHENVRMAAEREQFDETLAEISDRLGTFEARASFLAKELGVEGRIDPTGSGGPGVLVDGPRRSWVADEIKMLGHRTDSLDRSLAEIDGAFGERMRQLAATPSIVPVTGAWPDVRFSHGYGWRKDPIDGTRAFHLGVDIVAPTGSDVRATADGVVSRVGRFPDYGKSIELDHGYGFETRYAHLSRVLVSPGDRIERGDLIGLVGSTGRSTGPHLHYEVLRDGERVNPWKYLGQ